MLFSLHILKRTEWKHLWPVFKCKKAYSKPKYNRLPGWESNLGPPKYKVGVANQSTATWIWVVIFVNNLLYFTHASYVSGPTTVLSDGMKNIIAAMKENKIEYVSVCLSGWWGPLVIITCTFNSLIWHTYAYCYFCCSIPILWTRKGTCKIPWFKCRSSAHAGLSHCKWTEVGGCFASTFNRSEWCIILWKHVEQLT